MEKLIPIDKNDVVGALLSPMNPCTLPTMVTGLERLLLEVLVIPVTP